MPNKNWVCSLSKKVVKKKLLKNYLASEIDVEYGLLDRQLHQEI